MNKELAIKRIREIMDHVAETWTANDGGLTMAASGLIGYGNAAISRIEDDDIEWCRRQDPFDSSSGVESDISQYALQWAWSRIEEKLIDKIKFNWDFLEKAYALSTDIPIVPEPYSEWFAIVRQDDYSKPEVYQCPGTPMPEVGYETAGGVVVAVDYFDAALTKALRQDAIGDWQIFITLEEDVMSAYWARNEI